VANKSNHRGQTALHIAAGSDAKYYVNNGFPSMLDFLLQQDLGLDLHAQDHKGIMVIHLAASTSEINTWKLTRAGADLQAQTLNGRTPLHFAAGAAQSNVVGLLYQLYRERSWTIDQKDETGRIALHEAACSGNSECVYFLLQSGANPNVKDKQGLTPLHAAAEHQNNTDKLRKQLEDERLPYREDLRRGQRRLAPFLNVERGTSNAQSTMSLAIGQEEEARIIQDVVRLLLSAGADPAALDKFGHTAYDVAVMLGCEGVVDALSPRRHEIHSAANAAPLNPLADRWYLMRTIHAQGIVQSINIDDIKSYTLLETAIYFKNEAIINAVLGAGADPTTMSADGLTAMHMIARWGLTSVMKIMSSYVEDMNAFSPPLLHVAASRELSNIQMVDLLVKLGVNVNALHQECAKEYHSSHNLIRSYAAIHIFAAGKQWWHISALQSLCDAGADLELTDGDRKTALQCALSGNRSGSHGTGFWRDQTLELLLTQGANVNTLSPDSGSTPLITALGSKRGVKLIQKLLDCGADISLGKLPALFAAIESENLEATAAILEAGTDINAIYRPECAKKYNKGPKIETPLLAAAIKDGDMVIGTDTANSRASIMTLLLQRGSDPVMELRDGETTVLHEITYFSGLLGPILKTGVDLEIKDRQGRTPLLIACSPADIPYIAIKGEYAAHELIHAGANIRATDNAGSTPLHIAAASGLVQTVRLLISHGASISATNNAGLTPLYYALRHPSYPTMLQITQTLLSVGAKPLVTGPKGETALHLLAPSLISHSPADGADAQEFRL
jgi:ankyrin repeat protein